MSAPHTHPIGVFDSGVGGLSVVRALREELPAEEILYLADSANCPYGSRPAKEIRRISEGISRYLITQGCKLIVVACNTASAAALAHLRAALPDTPFVGMVPAVKPAAARTRSGVVGVLATPGTLGGDLYDQVVDHYATGVRVIAQSCAGLVEAVEAGDLDGPATRDLLSRCISPLLREGADTLVLGCTHYPFLLPTLRDLVGENVSLMETGPAVARQTARVLDQYHLRQDSGTAQSMACATTGDVDAFATALHRLLGLQAPVSSLRWEADRLIGASQD
ncbi:MAG: glutamate racemase [Anaerolineae bacterium]